MNFIVTAAVVEECNKPPFGRELFICVPMTTDEVSPPFCRYTYRDGVKARLVVEQTVHFVINQFDDEDEK